MPKDQRFGVCILGGFKKKTVIKYINRIMVEHEQEIDKIKEDGKLLNKKLLEELEGEKNSNSKYKEKILHLEKTINEYKNRISNVMLEKDNLIKQQSEKLKELENKIEKLQSQSSSDFDYENSEYQIKKAEYIAKEKVEQIIRKGKAKMMEEYQKRLMQWENDKEKLKKTAFKEASNILNNAAARVFNFNVKIQEDSENILKISKQKAKNILNSARLIADKILKYSAKVAYKQSGANGLPNYKLFSKFDIKILNEQANEEVLLAVEKLKELNLFFDKEEERSTIFKRYRKTALEGFMRRNNDNRD